LKEKKLSIFLIGRGRKPPFLLRGSDKGERMKKSNNKGIYLFGFARPVSVDVTQATGVDGRSPILLHPFFNITAVISSISLEAFCGPSSEHNMQDIAWIGPHAFRHEEVVERVMLHSPVFPARFGTIFSSVNRLENVLQINYAKIVRFLDQVTGKAEWSIKGFIDSNKAKDRHYAEALSEKAQRLAVLAPGARYFQEKRILAETEKQLKRRLKNVVGGISETLMPYASKVYERELLSRDVTGKDMVMNWAYLIPMDSVEGFRIQVHRINETYEEQDLNLTFSGPWPPYSFCPALGRA